MASVCCNRDLVRDVRECREDEELTIVTNGGEQVYHQMAILKELPIQVKLYIVLSVMKAVIER